MTHGTTSPLRRFFIALAALVLGGGFVGFLFGLGYHVGYAPEQPIPFSHKLHAGTYKIPCMYCHVTAEKSRHASVPSMNVCMNCHQLVKLDSPYIQKMHELYNKGEAFQWVKVHDLPDHVYFNHSRHVLRGVQCETCHGDVASMDRVFQHEKLSMGWCLDCHRGQTTPDYLYAEGQARGQVAPVNCNTCHN
jgi:hypothetical protein